MRWLLLGAWLCAATPAYAAIGEGGARDLIWHFVNLVILVTVIVYFGRKPIRHYFSERHASIRQSLESSARLLAEAEARLTEWRNRLEQLDAEVERIHATSRSLAEAERERILADARATAERIRRDAAAAVAQEVRRARVALREEAADLAIGLAERILRESVTVDDQERLVDEFVERVERARPDAGR